MVVDPALVARARSGDAIALEALLAGVWADGYRLAWSVLRDERLAEDAA